jgi:hypothetical protein
MLGLLSILGINAVAQYVRIEAPSTKLTTYSEGGDTTSRPCRVVQ